MGAIVSLITSLTIVYSTVNSGADQRKYQSSTSLAFVRGIHRRPVNSPHKRPATRKMFPFDDVIMNIIAAFLSRLYACNIVICDSMEWISSICMFTFSHILMKEICSLCIYQEVFLEANADIR